MYGQEQAVYSNKYAEPDRAVPQVEGKQSAVTELEVQTNKALENVKHEMFQLIYSLEDRGFLRPAPAATSGSDNAKEGKERSGIEMFMGTAINDMNFISNMLATTRNRLP